VTLPPGSAGTFTIEGQTRDLEINSKGSSIAGIVFDALVVNDNFLNHVPTPALISAPNKKGQK
jgi:hypothetical protein